MNLYESTRFPAERVQLDRIRRMVERFAEQTPASPEETQELVQAVDEAAANIIIHGYRDGGGEIEMDLEYTPGRISITLRDQAPPFDPTTVPAPNLKLPLSKRPVGGLGVHFIRCCVNEFTHASLPGGGNQVRLVKYLEGGASFY